MLIPTDMAEADPLASSGTVEGLARNRRVAVNVLVSKGFRGDEQAYGISGDDACALRERVIPLRHFREGGNPVNAMG